MRVKKEKFELNFINNKLDLEKAAKNLIAMAYTHPERIERSLEGGKCNKFPDLPPKRQATPRKLNALLGEFCVHHCALNFEVSNINYPPYFFCHLNRCN